MKKPWCGRCGIAALCLPGGIEAQYCCCTECNRRFFKLIRVTEKWDLLGERAWGYVYEDKLNGSPCVFGTVVADVRDDSYKITLILCPHCAENQLKIALNAIHLCKEK